VVFHVTSYEKVRKRKRCHGLVPWCLTLRATKKFVRGKDATGLSRGSPLAF
jgi:hypothetical protein